MNSSPYQPSPLACSTAVTQRWPLSTLFALAVGLPLTLDLSVLLATGTTGHFIWLFQQAAPLLVVAWPISLPIAIWICVALKMTSDADELYNRRLLWLTPLLVIPISTLVWGAVFEHPRGHGYVQWQLTVVHWAFFATIAIGILGVALNRGRRSFVAASTLMLLLFSFSCSFTAGSSVTGDWL